MNELLEQTLKVEIVESKTLKDVLPQEFLGSEYRDDKAYKFKDVEVLRKYDARDKPWPGFHKNVTYWYVLNNGYAVGVNESPSRGLSFPVMKYQEEKNE